MTRITVLPAAAITVLALLAGGCSDDLTCPEIGSADPVPYIAARVAQGTDGRYEFTHAEVACTADPLPSLLIAFINGREIPAVEPNDDMGELAVLDDDVVLWQPGTQCSLKVTTDFGYATAGVAAPDAAQVTAPATIATGDTLTVEWRRAAGADYYEVSAVLVPDAVAAGGAPGGRNTLTLSAVTRDTFVVFLPGFIPAAGAVSGLVEAVSGPFPESGARGNISGDGWGFFTVRYADEGSSFEVVVSDAR